MRNPITETTTTLPTGTDTIEVGGRAVAVAAAAASQAIDPGPAPAASAEDSTGGRNAFGLERRAVKLTTLPQLATEQFTTFVPGQTLIVEIIGARTTAQFVIKSGTTSDVSVIAAALNESAARLETNFARIVAVEPIGEVDSASLADLANAKSTNTLMSRVFADAELPAPARLTDLSIPKTGRWLKVTGQADGYVPGSVVYLAVTSTPIVFAESIVDSTGRARLVGSFPIDLLPAGGHRLRVVGIRQIYATTLDRAGEVQLAESTIAEISQFDTQSTATLRITGLNDAGGYHSAIRSVSLRVPLPWWTLWIVAWTAFLALIARLTRKLTSRRERMTGTVLVILSSLPSQYLGWTNVAFNVNFWGVAIVILGSALIWLVPPLGRTDSKRVQ